MRILQPPPNPEPATRYQWDEWLTGQIIELTHGDDYHCATKSLANYLRTKAKQRGIHIRVSIRLTIPETIVFCSYGTNDVKPILPHIDDYTPKTKPLEDSTYTRPTCVTCGSNMGGSNNHCGLHHIVDEYTGQVTATEVVAA